MQSIAAAYRAATDRLHHLHHEVPNIRIIRSGMNHYFENFVKLPRRGARRFLRFPLPTFARITADSAGIHPLVHTEKTANYSLISIECMFASLHWLARPTGFEPLRPRFVNSDFV
jgi:hypothetical protein